MRLGKKISTKGLKEVEQLLKEVKSASELKAVQCVWLRGKEGLTSKQIAIQIGWSESHVKRVHIKYFKYGAQSLKRKASSQRRNENMSVEEEKQFLERFIQESKTGEIIRVGEIKEAYEQEIGKQVPKSTIYRLLDRHDWRKIVPRPRHPKVDRQAQELFKKTA